MTSFSAALNRRSVLAGAAAALPLALTATPLAGAAPPEDQAVPVSAIRNYADMVAFLTKLERTARYPVTVRTLRQLGVQPGVSEAGRDLYVATVGTGPQKVWVQGRIHGNEPYGLESQMTVLRALAHSGAAPYQAIRDAFTVHFIPMYNPDGSELNVRYTVLQDGSGRRVDLNRDWAPDAFVAKESVSWYTYWTQVKPDFGLDIHHQWLKEDPVVDKPITLSLGVSLAPDGPTLPTIRGGSFNTQTKQLQGHVYGELLRFGFIEMDRYYVGEEGEFYEIDIKGGVASAVMIGLNWRGMNPTGHAHPMIFFETSGMGNEIGSQHRGRGVRQNVEGMTAFLSGLADGRAWQTDPNVWNRIPRPPFAGYLQDHDVVVPLPH